MNPAHDDAAHRMDRMYRLQRRIYDPTRRWYLLGRDRLIRELDPPPGGTVLEIACGTARNLVRIGETWPDTTLYGVDVSAEMLKSAHANRRRAGLQQRMTLAPADATDFDPVACLNGPARFDRVVIAYALSMIPDWPAAIDHAITLLAPGGSLHVVDFDVMQAWPRPARAAMSAWLARFDVTPRPEALDALAERGRRRGAVPTSCTLVGGYASLTHLRMPAAREPAA
jgi:S-adenosylmethionine-diacylgycerolhomoserine-N-methlytransferase